MKRISAPVMEIRHSLLFRMVIILGLLASGCQGTVPTVTAEPVAILTSTPLPTLTPAPTPTSIPTSTPVPTPTPVPVSEKYISFVSNRDGRQDIYAISGDGGQLVRLTNDVKKEFSPQWSPDGRKIAFISTGDEENMIFWMTIGDKDATPLTSGYNVRQFEWSPDGKKIVFASRKPKSGIYVVPVEGGQPTELVAGTKYYYVPTWSPDGNYIAYLAGDENLRQVYLMNADGSEQQLLTTNSYKKLYAIVWSPDGKQIAFSGEDKNSDIYLINLEDKRLTQLTNDSLKNEVIAGAYSPDGQWLLFWSATQDMGDIYRINIQTGQRERLTSDPHDDYYPRWSSDGRKIVFNSYRDGNEEIYLLDLQSMKEQNLTNHPAEDFDYTWYPLEPALELGKLAKLATEEAIPSPLLPLPERGLIIYFSDSDGSPELYTAFPDGSHSTRLTNNDLYEIDMDWSPDCSEAVISAFPEDSSFDEDSNLFLIRRDGSNFRQVTYMSFAALIPQWSPDGSEILFLSDDPGVTDLYVLELDTNKVTKLTREPLGGDLHSVPWQYNLADWSPDGKWIVYFGPGKADWDIYKASIGRRDVTVINQDSPADISPAWSPDGKHIAFVRYLPAGCKDNCNLEIFVMKSDGSEIKQTVQSPKDDFSPIWSPDGQKILFLSNRDGNSEIYIVNLDGSGVKNLTGNKADDYYPIWSPDGSQIIFTSERDGNPEIYVMNNDGTNIIRLTNNPGNDYPKAWLCGSG